MTAFEELGFTPNEVGFLVEMSQCCFGPDEFDRDVQRYLDEWEEK